MLARSFNEMTASLQVQIDQLAELSDVQRRFVSDVSHELRTPLTTVRMASEMIYGAREDFEPVIKRSAELLHTQLDRFEDLLADLLEISRFDAGAAVLDAEATDLRDVVMLAVDNVVSEQATADGRTIAAFGLVQTTPIESQVPGYLERFKPHGQFNHYRG